MEIAKIFWTGRSQAVRLPKAFRIDGDRVRIRRRGSSIILEPCESDWDWLRALAGPVDDDFARAARDQLPMQTRETLDDL
jgi:antitoxin VapB